VPQATRAASAETLNIDENAPRDIHTFDEWATYCGIQKAEGVQVIRTSKDHKDISMITQQDIPAGQPVLFVPGGMILTGGNARQELGDVDGAEELMVRLGATEHLPQFYLLLKILTEYENGDQSPYYPWLNSLPRYFTSGAHMTDFCCSNVLPPLVGKLASKERIRFLRFFRALQYVPFLSNTTKKNRILAKWAFAIVYTRCFDTPDGDARIVPMADFLDHGTFPEVEISYDEEGNCYAYSTYDIPAGSPLRISYGDPTNPSYLFARYGFLDESSPATFCKIMIDNPSQELQNLGYDHSRMLFYKDTGDVSEEVWDVLLYQILQEVDPNTQQAFYSAHMTGDVDTKQAIHQQFYPQTRAALNYHVDSFLQQLDVLSSRAHGRDLKVHPRLPIILQHNEFVKETFQRVKTNLQQ